MYTVWHLGESGKSRHFSVDPIPRHSSFNPSLIFFSSFFYLAPFLPFRNHQLHQVIRAPLFLKFNEPREFLNCGKFYVFTKFRHLFFFFLIFNYGSMVAERLCEISVSRPKDQEFSNLFEKNFSNIGSLLVEF